MSIALGSWWSMLALIPLSMLLFRRLLIEDRYLKENLDGYAQYAERVRSRLIPGIW
jgi:protein-S-isoprenylcysteine O-methyltransferase Ste14